MTKKSMQETLADINREVDENADKKLGQIQKSKWTGAILIVVALVIVIAGLSFLL